MRFEEFAAGRLPALLRYATVLTADPVQAQDIVQEVMVRACTRWSRICATDAPDAYVRRMILNEFLSWRRRWAVRSVRAVPDHELEAGQPPGPDPAVGLAERAEVRQRLTALPPRQRAVVVLRFYEQLDDAEIAALLGIRPATVRSALSRALSSLRNADPGRAPQPSDRAEPEEVRS